MELLDTKMMTLDLVEIWWLSGLPPKLSKPPKLSDWRLHVELDSETSKSKPQMTATATTVAMRAMAMRAMVTNL